MDVGRIEPVVYVCIRHNLHFTVMHIHGHSLNWNFTEAGGLGRIPSETISTFF